MLLRAFEAAREIGRARLLIDGVPALALPWLRDDLERLSQLFDGDAYRHGFEPNRELLTTLARYAAEQGITPTPVDVTELFAPETRD